MVTLKVGMFWFMVMSQTKYNLNYVTWARRINK